MISTLRMRSLCTALVASLMCGALSAQIRQPGRPASESAALPSEVPTVHLLAPDVAALLAEEEAQSELGPFRYGAVIETRQDLAQVGRWDEVAETGAYVWRLRIAAPGAHTLGVVFDRFEIPEGGRVFLYNDDRSHVLGAYNQLTNKPNGQLGVEPLVGDALTIEYVQERWASGTPRLRVGEVIYDYKSIYEQGQLWSTPGANNAGPCLVDVNCPEGAPYQVLKRAVLRGLSGGSTCSASMLNNTANDATPYMLTANHCGSFANTVVVFNFELPECGSGTAPTTDTVSGSTLLASTSAFDSQLFLLSETPPLDYHVYYAGWDRGTTTVAPGVSISHPQGLPKKLALDDSGAVSFGATYWRVTWDLGILFGGSSGSPLFNGNGQVLGPACCVTDFVCGSQSAFYGRLEKFWGSQPIAQYLDPIGNAPFDIGGYDPCPPAVTYCTAKTNSCGTLPVLTADGIPQASKTSGLLLAGSGAQPGKAGLALYSPNGRQVPALPFQGGVLCINPQGMRRSAAIGSVGGTPGNCDAAFEIDWNAFASGNAGGNPAAFLSMPGQQVNVQWWGRDSIANGSYLSDALEYTVCP